ncbi:MAG: hypothetical protein H7A36_02925 [Chlamydiales bacterium]|nr:hypothetical protein [Chlamydiales bacterium]
MIKYLLSLVLLFGCQAKERDAQQRIYLLHSISATLVRDPIDEHTGNLTMIDLNSSVVFFSSPPKKATGTIPITTFINKWESARANLKTPPKSAGFLYYKIGDKEYNHIAIELILPNYNAGSETLSVVLQAFGEKFPEKELKMEEVTLFLDLDL